MAERPATSSAGPRRPRPVISRPSAAVASFPWVYRLGEQKTDNIGLASEEEIEISQVSAAHPPGSPLLVDPLEDSDERNSLPAPPRDPTAFGVPTGAFPERVAAHRADTLGASQSLDPGAVISGRKRLVTG